MGLELGLFDTPDRLSADCRFLLRLVTIENDISTSSRWGALLANSTNFCEISQQFCRLGLWLPFFQSSARVRSVMDPLLMRQPPPDVIGDWVTVATLPTTCSAQSWWDSFVRPIC